MQKNNLVLKYSEIVNSNNLELGPVLNFRKLYKDYFTDEDGFVIINRGFYLYKLLNEITGELYDEIANSYANLPIHDTWVKIIAYKYKRSRPEKLTSRGVKFAKGDTSVIKCISDFYLENLHIDEELVIEVQSVDQVSYSGVAMNNADGCDIWVVGGVWGEQWSSGCRFKVADQIEATDVKEVPIYTTWGHGVKETGSGIAQIEESDMRSLCQWLSELEEKIGKKIIIEWQIQNNALEVNHILIADTISLMKIGQGLSKKKFDLRQIGVGLSSGVAISRLTDDINNCAGQILIINKPIDNSLIENLKCTGIVCTNSNISWKVGVIARDKSIPAVAIVEPLEIVSGVKVLLDGDSGVVEFKANEYESNLVKKTKTSVISNINYWGETSQNSDGVLLNLDSICDLLICDSNYKQQRISELITAKVNQIKNTDFYIEIGGNEIELWQTGVSSKGLIDQASGVWIAHKYNPNLNLIIPGIKHSSEFQEIKKLLYFNQIKRTGNFGVFLKLDVPSLVDSLLTCVNDGLDGVVIDADKLFALWSGENKNNEITEQFIEYLLRTVDLCFERSIPCFVSGLIVVFNPDVVQKLVKGHVTGFVSPNYYLTQLSLDIARNEINISKNKHRELKKSPKRN